MDESSNKNCDSYDFLFGIDQKLIETFCVTSPPTSKLRKLKKTTSAPHGMMRKFVLALDFLRSTTLAKLPLQVAC